jgi:hypothetical protein
MARTLPYAKYLLFLDENNDINDINESINWFLIKNML